MTLGSLMGRHSMNASGGTVNKYIGLGSRGRNRSHTYTQNGTRMGIMRGLLAGS